MGTNHESYNYKLSNISVETRSMSITIVCMCVCLLLFFGFVKVRCGLVVLDTYGYFKDKSLEATQLGIFVFGGLLPFSNRELNYSIVLMYFF